jgi:AcrR family transcriptional regulator
MSASRIQTWIQAGYATLATEGFDGMKIERLARVLQLNKSGFYYYFGTLESYLKSLIEYHIRIAKKIAVEIVACKQVDPDLLHVIIQHKTFFLVESKLLAKNKLFQFDDRIAAKIIDDALIQLLRKKSDLSHDTLLTYLNICRYFFYARIDQENITFDYFHGLASEIKALLSKAVVDKINFARPTSDDKST